MPIDELLIPEPVLDDRKEEDRIARRIHRSIGGLTVEDAELGVAYFEKLKALIEENGAAAAPLLPELSSARPAETHVALLREIERAVTYTVSRINQVPDKNRVGFLRLLGVTLQPAKPSTTTLQFTKTGDYLNVEVVIPSGVEVGTEDRRFRVSTDRELTIAEGAQSGTVAATSVEHGDIRLPANTLGLLLQSVAGIASVSNTTGLAGGAAAESVDQGKIRARELMRVGEHLGSAQDFVDHIFFKVLNRQGRVTAFEGHFSDFRPAVTLSPSPAGLVELPSPGYLLLVVQSQDGSAPSEQALAQIRSVVRERKVAGVYVSVRPPAYRDFDITAQVTFARGQQSETIKNRARQLLRERYSPLKFEYGPEFPARAISVSDIAARIDDAAPDLIDVKTVDGRLQVIITSGGVDYTDHVSLSVGELPRLGQVNLITAS